MRNYSLDGVRTIDRYTYEITLAGLYPQFIYWLAIPFFAPMPWEAELFYKQPGMEDRNLVLDWFPIGTGPFMLTENDPNLRMVLARNPNFRGELYPSTGEAGDDELLVDAGRPMPFIDRAVYTRERESIPAWNKFLQGYFDTSGISSDGFDQAVVVGEGGNATLSPAMQSKGIRLATAVTVSQFYMGFNMQDPVVGGLEDRARPAAPGHFHRDRLRGIHLHLPERARGKCAGATASRHFREPSRAGQVPTLTRTPTGMASLHVVHWNMPAG